MENWYLKENNETTINEIDGYIAIVNSQDNYIAKINSYKIPDINEIPTLLPKEYFEKLHQDMELNPNMKIAKEDAKKLIKRIERVKNMKEIKIKYHNKDIEKLTYINGKSDWIDLRAAEDVVLKAGEFKLISLGVSMELPEGYEAHIVPRSSTYKNFGIIQTNHHAIIDNSYKGDGDIWRYPAYALRDTEIHVNDRICQFRIVENQPEISFLEVENLGNEDRAGFGSTGK